MKNKYGMYLHLPKIQATYACRRRIGCGACELGCGVEPCVGGMYHTYIWCVPYHTIPNTEDFRHLCLFALCSELQVVRVRVSCFTCFEHLQDNILRARGPFSEYKLLFLIRSLSLFCE